MAITALHSAASGLKALSTRIDVVANNLDVLDQIPPDQLIGNQWQSDLDGRYGQRDHRQTAQNGGQRMQPGELPGDKTEAPAQERA